MPFESKLQHRFAYAHPEKFGGEAGLKEWSDATDFKNLPEKASNHMEHVTSALAHKPKMAKKHEDKRKHGIHHTHIQSHPDGSHTVNMTGPAGEHGGAAMDLDAVHDMLQKHMGAENPGEAEASPMQAGANG